jgi:hypothetical protein
MMAAVESSNIGWMLSYRTQFPQITSLFPPL